MTCKGVSQYLHEITKWQGAHISLKLCLIQKIKKIYLLQLWKLKREKCTHFHDRSWSWGVMVILLFHEDTGKPLRSHKMTNSSYLPQMMLNPKNKGTLFSSTLKVEEKKVHLFSWSEVNLVSYDHFVVSWRHRTSNNIGSCQKIAAHPNFTKIHQTKIYSRPLCHT